MGMLKQRMSGDGFRKVVLIGLSMSLTIFPGNMRAQEPATTGLIGKRVVQKFPGFKLHVGGQAIVPGRIEIYTIVENHGHELMLSAEGRGLRGLAPIDQVVEVERAFDFCATYMAGLPDDPWGPFLRAILWQKQKKDLDRALHDFELAVRLSRKRTTSPRLRSAILCGRGVAWEAKKEYDKAIDDYSAAIELDRRNVVARQDRASVWTAKKQYERAIADLDEAIRLRPSDAVLYFDRGRARHKKGDFDKAIDDFSEAVSLRPYFANAFTGRGTSWNAKKSYDRALADFNTAIRLEPGSSVGYNARGWFWATCPDARHRNGDGALESATKSCDLTHWKNATGLDTLAAACAERGEFANAVKWETQALELSTNPSKTEEYRARLMLYQQKKAYRQ